jgi:hypothetical protein
LTMSMRDKVLLQSSKNKREATRKIYLLDEGAASLIR